jgi:hypothetical protein
MIGLTTEPAREAHRVSQVVCGLVVGAKWLEAQQEIRLMPNMNDQLQPQPRVKAGGLRGLLALNGALLLILAAVTFAPGSSVEAQNRGRGEYTMVAGGLPNVDADGIYILDVQNQEMVIMAYDTQTKVLQGIGYRNLAADAAAQRRGNRPSN